MDNWNLFIPMVVTVIVAILGLGVALMKAEFDSVGATPDELRYSKQLAIASRSRR